VNRSSVLSQRAFVGVVVLIVIAAASHTSAGAPERSRPLQRVYSHLIDPPAHPDYGRRAVKPPTWESFKNRTQFTCLRGFAMEDDRIVGYREEIEKYTRTHELGDVIWPSYPILFAKNLDDLAEEIKRRDLYLFDIWGYVPGSGPGGYWQQFTPSAESLRMLEATLGERWLGTDIGEQDGRYIGGYANQMTPASGSRFDQYLNFQRFFERMGDDLGHRHATLVSLNFGHYLLKEGTFTLIGAETAQALPNNQVYYAFIRGAGKQYGVPWFGNASVYNRWGYKTYGSSGSDHGPSKGTSLSLMKRLLYSHVLYNSVAVGFESGWFEGEALSPIGRIQQAGQRWIRQHGQPGVMYTPVALLLDFHAGWSFPRHLYSSDIFRVWGNLPYGPGDHLTDAILDLLYPGYADSSYFHDETGFITATPYGDIADCLLSDAPGWLLSRYALVVVAGELAGGWEIRDKLQDYVEGGGHLVITTGNLARLPGGVAGQTEAAVPAVTKHGKGCITVLATGFGVDPCKDPNRPLRSEVDRALPRPYVLQPEARRTLDAILRQQTLFDVGNPDLSVTTCRQGPGSYTLGIANNTWVALPFKITSHCGPVQSLDEIPLDDSEIGAAGYLPEQVAGASLGHNTDRTIRGGDIRIFAVRVKESNVEAIAHVPPPRRPHGRILPLRDCRSVKEQILARPTFFEHFDGAVLDWRYVHDRERTALQREADWIKRQGLRVLVDVSSGLNLYPTLRLVDNIEADYEQSMAALADVMAKMHVLGAHDLILSLHRHPENNFTNEQTQAGFEETLRTLAAEAGKLGITLHLRMTLGKPPWTLGDADALIERVGADNLRLAASTALLLHAEKSAGAVRILKARLGLWLLGAPQVDLVGKLWDIHAPLHRSEQLPRLAECLALVPEAPVVLDAVLANQDEEYLEAVALERLGSGKIRKTQDASAPRPSAAIASPMEKAEALVKGLSGPQAERIREARLASWWRDAKFGLFLHWGPASLSGAEISWGMKDRIEGGSEHQKVERDVYMKLYRQFNPTQLDADAWMGLAKEAGMKYVVFVTKHHDGFSMWPTGQVRFSENADFSIHYSIADTPYKRDICRMIADAAHRHGLKLGWYYSTRDWTHPQYLQGDNHLYNQYYEAQVRELLADYGRVDMMWFDHCFGDWSQYTIVDLFKEMYRLQPDLLVNDRAARGLKDIPAGGTAQLVRGDYDTPEQRIGTFQRGRAWESCVTMTHCPDGGGWSYRPDGRIRTLPECIRMLVSTVTGDGNLLLNIGPMPTGAFQPQEIANLKGMGQWLRTFGESIYGTRGGPYRNGEWGGSCYRDRTLYLHVFQWAGDTLRLPPLKARVLHADELAGGPVDVEQSNAGLTLVLTADRRDATDTVIKLELDAPVENEFIEGKPLDVSRPLR